MRYIDNQTCQPPTVRHLNVLFGRHSKVVALFDVEQRKKFLSDKNSWTLLADYLGQLSHGKCWYCEAKLRRTPYDVDHFRPKKTVTIDRVALGKHEGYYWLAYNWKNFRLSCVHCNRLNKSEIAGKFGKGNEFAIRNEKYRARHPDDKIALEEPKFLDPCVEQDTKLLAHLVNGEVHPASKKDSDPWSFERARYTIETLGFNRPSSPGEAESPVAHKLKQWADIKLLIEAAELISNLTEVQNSLREKFEDKAEYSCYFRAAISTYRTKHWVAAVL